MAATAAQIPPITKQTLDDYRDHRLHPGRGIREVLSNDLRGAFTYCDEATCRALPVILSYISTFPRESWGSPAAVNQWLSRGRA